MSQVYIYIFLRIDPWFTAYWAPVSNTDDDPLEAWVFMEEPMD